MTTLTDTQVVTASGGLVELGYAEITGNVTVNNATPGTGTQVIAPLTVVCDGSPVLVEFSASLVSTSSTSGDFIVISLFQDGVEKVREFADVINNATGTLYVPVQATLRTTPTAGSHTFSIRAYVTNTARAGYVYASSSTTTYAPAFLRVSKIVQATQWPAVTTGTIICTSTTRPASPFAGQSIYETDTGRKYLYTGSAWVSDTPALVLLNSTAVSAQSSVTIDSVFSSTYDNYLVIPRISGSGNAGLLMRLRSGGADDSSANYSYQHLTGQGTTVSAANSSAQTSWVAGSAYSINTPAQEILIVAPNLAGRTSYKTTFTQDGGSSLFLRTYAGDLSTSTQYTGLTIYPPSGTITGAIRVYGYTN